MEQMNQCPNCGKYVSADKTYCMNCGTTLGVRCEGCGRVLPVGTKACVGCGHSFVRKTKKKRREPRVLPLIKRHAHVILMGVLAAAVLAVAILAALPALYFEMVDTAKIDSLVSLYSTSGYGLAGYFVGAHPEGVVSLLADAAFTPHELPLRLCLYAVGIGYLAVLVGLSLTALLAAVNSRRFGRLTARRMILPLAVSTAGAGIAFGVSVAVRRMLTDAATLTYLTQPEVAPNVVQKPITYAITVGSNAPLIMLIMTALLTAVHISLYLLSIKSREASSERPLGAILAYPFRTLARLVRRLLHRRGEEKTVTCTRNFRIYLILLAASLIFTQVLRSKVSHIFFWFVLILLPLLLIYALLSRAALSVGMISDDATIEKGEPFTYEFVIRNSSPLASPFIDAELSIPQSNSVRCTRRTVRLSMAPLSGYHVKNTVCFRFRGTYDIGVRGFYVHDFFRLFRVYLPVDTTVAVAVLPRRMQPDEVSARAISDATLRTVRSPLAVDKLEVSDIRDYRPGDPLRSIHWKLSSKSEEFIVKEHNTGTSTETVIFCDMTPHFPDEPMSASADSLVEGKKSKRTSQKSKSKKAATPAQPAAEPAAAPDVHRLLTDEYYEDMNEYVADGVVELTVAHVLAELQAGNDVLLVWFDRRADGGIFAYPVRDAGEFERVWRTFATAPLCAPDRRVAELAAITADSPSAKQLFVTGSLDTDMMDSLSRISGVTDGAGFDSAEVVLYNPEERFLHPAARASYLEGCAEQLREGGFALSVYRSADIARMAKGGDGV